METKITKLNPADLHDFQELVLIFKDVFEGGDLDLPEDKNLQGLLGNSNFL